MSEREEKFEAMLAAVRGQYAATAEKLERLKAENKTKTATYRQLIGEKLTLQNMLSLYKIHGLIE